MVGSDALARAWVDAHRYTAPSRRGARYVLARFMAADDVDGWWRSLSHLSASSKRNHWSVVRCYCRWLMERGEIERDPLAGIRPPKPPRPNPVTISTDDHRALAAACTNPRDRSILALMYGIGLRCVEVSRLEVGDVDFDGRLVAVRGKGGRDDVLPLPESVARVLRSYLDEHPASAGPLIRDLRWHRFPITAQRVSEVMARLATDAGVKRRPYDGRGAHALRRTCATELLEAGANVRQVQAVLRHASLRSTEHYLRRSSADELRAVVELRA